MLEHLEHTGVHPTAEFSRRAPFGPSLVYLGLLFLPVLGLGMMTRPGHRPTGVAMVLLSLILVGLECKSGEIDHNPRIKSEELVGTWVDGTVTLKS